MTELNKIERTANMCDRYIVLHNNPDSRKVLFQCVGCGKCCSDLSISERLHVSWHLRTIMPSVKCYFLTEKNKCSVYESRPPLCKKWECGVVYEG